MDGIHDLGGKQGYGAIPIGDDEPFHHGWERRMWSMARCGILPAGTNIDQFRHGLERMVPADYLSIGYFNKWCVNYMMLYVSSETFTMDEVLSGHSETRAEPAPARTLDQIIEFQRGLCIDFSTPTDIAPLYGLGDTVTTKRLMPSGHNRLPAYARNATGTVITCHGAHLLADKGAAGIHEGEQLYTVSFRARELWGDNANPRDTVTLELWESYFV